MQIPVLETERLRLRGHRVEDLDACCQLWGDLEVTRHIGGRPLTAEEVWSRLLRYAGHWSLLGFGYWLVEEKANGAFVGEVGIADLRRTMEPPLGGRAELGWVVSPGKQGLGYATEAVTAALDWGLGRFEAGELRCLIEPGNSASVRVARRCGLVELFESKYKGSAVMVMGVPDTRGA